MPKRNRYQEAKKAGFVKDGKIVSTPTGNIDFMRLTKGSTVRVAAGVYDEWYSGKVHLVTPTTVHFQLLGPHCPMFVFSARRDGSRFAVTINMDVSFEQNPERYRFTTLRKAVEEAIQWEWRKL